MVLTLAIPGLAAETAPAPGYGELGYALPAVGSYQLPPLGLAGDGQVLDEQGRVRQLHALMKGGKYTLLSFIYSHCQDVNGCPLAGYVFYRLKALMQEQPGLAQDLRLLSLSFDPERDTPAVMHLYGENYRYAGPAGEWRFLTTASAAELEPLLTAYRQDIQRELSVNGEANGDYAHILRVFLIDPQLQIRNIYSVSFLHADLILNDLQTLLQQKQPPADEPARMLAQIAPEHPTGDTVGETETRTPETETVLSRPGDGRTGYGQNYRSDSLALTGRQQQGRPADLLALARKPPLGLPALPAGVLASLNPDRIALGRKLFFDRRLSLNDTLSCAMCHVPEQGFTNNEIQTAVGLEGRSVRRNTPTLYNVAYLERLFHDGREFRLEEQIWSPLLAWNEMANPAIGQVLEKIRQLPDYAGYFEQAYQAPLSMVLLGNALAAYQRTLLSADSPFDRWHYGGMADAMDPKAIEGFRLFTGKAACVTCHQVGKSAALFTDQQLHNTGIGYRESMGIRPPKQRVTLAPGVTVEVDRQLIDQVSAPAPRDLGLYEITQNPADRWKYRTPGLRNVVLTAPYMHNGSLASLNDVVRFYNEGGIPNPELSPLIRPLGLSEAEIDSLVAFLASLTGSNVDQLVADAFAAPVGDLKPDDPNWANRQSSALPGENR